MRRFRYRELRGPAGSRKHSGRGGRAVQCTGLENRRAKALVGSNPTPSALQDNDLGHSGYYHPDGRLGSVANGVANGDPNLAAHLPVRQTEPVRGDGTDPTASSYSA